jgi:hypothetical protein
MVLRQSRQSAYTTQRACLVWRLVQMVVIGVIGVIVHTLEVTGLGTLSFSCPLQLYYRPDMCERMH